MRCFFPWLVFPFLVFPFMVIMYWLTLATFFWPLFLLHCYNQVATTFTFFLSDDSVTLLLMKCLPSKTTRELHLKTVVRKLQSLNLLATKTDVPLEHFYAPKVRTSHQRLRLTWITTYLRNIQQCKQKTPTSVTIVWRNFLAIVRYEKIGAVNMEFR